MKLGLGILLSSGQDFNAVLDGMSFRQISLAAECVTLARVEFAQKVVMEPIFQLVSGLVGGEVETSEPETEAQRRRRGKRRGKPAPRKRGAAKKKGATEITTDEQRARARARDAHIAAIAARFGIPINDG